MRSSSPAFTSRNYKYPFGVVFAYSLAVVAVGMADGALQAFRDDMKVRLGAYDGAKAMDILDQLDEQIPERACENEKCKRLFTPKPGMQGHQRFCSKRCRRQAEYVRLKRVR